MAKIFIDAGHGGKDAGAVNGKIFEKNIALNIALKLEKMLKAYGIETIMSRTTDVFVTLQDRAKLANNFDLDIVKYLPDLLINFANKIQ